MSETKITRPFADGTYNFDLTFPLASEFERLMRKSLHATMNAILAKDYRINDVAEIIRLALVGGGTDADRADELVYAYVRTQPVGKHVLLCSEILEAAFFGTTKTAANEEADRVFGSDDE